MLGSMLFARPPFLLVAVVVSALFLLPPLPSADALLPPSPSLSLARARTLPRTLALPPLHLNVKPTLSSSLRDLRDREEIQRLRSGLGRVRAVVKVVAGAQYEKYIKKMFEQADVNNDGFISLEESNPVVLRLYIRVNRLGPVNPPTLSNIARTFAAADETGTGLLSPDEFSAFCASLLSRAALKVTVFNSVRFILAPVLASGLARELTTGALSRELLGSLYKIDQQIFSSNPELLTTITVVIFVAFLGNVAVWSIDVVEALREKVKERFMKGEGGGDGGEN